MSEDLFLLRRDTLQAEAEMNRPISRAAQVGQEVSGFVARFHDVPMTEPALLSIHVLARMDRWFAMYGLPKSATESYSDSGWRPALGHWSTTGQLRASLYDNMGGGVPIELLQTMIVLAHEEAKNGLSRTG